MDSSWKIVDSFPSANGYAPDEHDLRVFPDGGYALLALSKTTLDSNQWVPGMDTAATIRGDVIQIFDAHGHETFEWRGIDHYRVSDAIHENLHDTLIDFEHANSLDFDSGGNIIISNRYLCEITKINRQTGNIMWRFGGAHNQFLLLGDSIWFSYQHDARSLPGAHLTLFDNGDYDTVYAQPHDSGVYIRESRALEYALDTTAMTAALVWQYHHTPETYSIAMGNVERLPNGNTFIGWGVNWDGIAMTEVRPDHTTTFEMIMGNGNWSYRAMKYPSENARVASPTVSSPIGLSIVVSPLDIVAKFTLPRYENITLRVCDALGRQVVPEISSFQSFGLHRVPIETQALPSGTYYCEVHLADGSSALQQFAIVR